MLLKRVFKFVPAMLLAAVFVAGPVINPLADVSVASAAEAKKNVLKGKILGKSKKAKTITIKAGKKSVMVKFNDSTKGVEHAAKGKAAIINFKMVGKDKVATSIKPKLAKLPKGVTEIQPDALAELVKKGPKKANYLLVDSRPGKRYAEGYIPTAISIPVPKMKKEGKTLLAEKADNKNTLLIFYCGGPT